MAYPHCPLSTTEIISNGIDAEDYDAGHLTFNPALSLRVMKLESITIILLLF